MFIKTLTTSFLNLKIYNKLLLGMLLVTLFACSLMGISSYTYLAHSLETRAVTDTEKSLQVLTVSLEQDINHLYEAISSFVSTPDFIQTIAAIESNNQALFSKHYIGIQASLLSTIQRSSLIENLFILGKNGEFYSTLDIGLKYRSTAFDLLDNVHYNNLGISWLPSTPSPITYLSDEVIPVVFPITLSKPQNTPFISNDSQDPIVHVVALINTTSLNHTMSQINKNTLSTLYIANEKGMPITLPSTYKTDNFLSLNLIRDTVTSADSFTPYEINTSEGMYIITTSDLHINNLKLVSIISKSLLLSGMSDIQFFTLLAFTLSILFCSIICIGLSKTLTLPLKKLTKDVTSLETNNYSPTFASTYTDEIGLLTSSFNQMCHLINEQFDKIKEDERLQHQAQLDILAHQINPHFLYNTLEHIHWEILANNNTSAALMTETLGDFLRLSLNIQDTTIPLSEEIEHTKKYLDIINLRTRKAVTLITTIPHELFSYPTIRLILQPCVENTIKHAFSNDYDNWCITSPTIYLSAVISSNYIHLKIEDNGKGIDTDRAHSAIFSPDSPDTKVGLRNIYQRLRTYYNNDVDILIQSIPFYRNSITLVFPLNQALLRKSSCTQKE